MITLNKNPIHLFRRITQNKMSVMAAMVLCLTDLATSANSSAFPSAGELREVQIELHSAMTYCNPFMDVVVDVKFTEQGYERTVPAFWAGGSTWRCRYAPRAAGAFRYETVCSDHLNKGLNHIAASLTSISTPGNNPLYTHGAIQLAADHRHFEHRDGTPFLWLADTWWKGLSKRLSLADFQTLTADRRAKGFNVVQIVCGPYPDEGLFEKRWGNEAGLPYTSRDFSTVNPAYFEAADLRIRSLIKAGLVPAIVGGWGRGGSLEAIGLAGYKRHWRNLIARYSAYPVVWIIGGEAGGKDWTELAKFVRATDPFHRPITMHPGTSARDAVTDESAIDFDMLQTGHGDWNAALGAVPQIRSALARTPVMPALIGEACYEGHMQSAFQDVERYLFWTSMLSGAAGHTYGAAGIWHAGIEGDPGITPVYDWTTWRQGMVFAGSTQVGMAKTLLESYPWQRFEPHQDWCAPNCFCAGIPGEMRFIYQPRNTVYNWTGTVVKGLEKGAKYHAFYWNPVDGRRHEVGNLYVAGPGKDPFTNHNQPLLYDLDSDLATGADWTDKGTASILSGHSITGHKGMLTLNKRLAISNGMVSVNAHSNAEAGIIFRFHDPNNYVVALYSPLLKAIYFHDRKNGQWGNQLGRVDVSGIGSEITLTAAVSGDDAAMRISDGKSTWYTHGVKLHKQASGPIGLWMYQVGDSQTYTHFKASQTSFTPDVSAPGEPNLITIWSTEYTTPGVPSPQDWILILERARPHRTL